MKKLIFIMALILAIFAVSSCVSNNAGTPTNFYGDQTSVSRTGEATNIVYLAVFGTQDYPPADKVARENGISRIATVERYRKIGVLGLWVEYTTIVSGQ